MTRRDILMRLAAFAACVRAYAKTPQGAGAIVVRIGERRSDICLVRRGALVTQESIPIGRGHFVSDIARCLDVDLAQAAELLEHYRASASQSLLADIVEARAVEFGGFLGACIMAAGAGEVFTAPVLLGGFYIAGLAETVERIAGWEVRYAPNEATPASIEAP
jgi:cell division ATPase FtsA